MGSDPKSPKIEIGDRKRLVGVVIGLFVLFSFLIVQFYHIQIIEGDKWNRVAERQHYFVVKEPFKRGTFYSNTSIKQGHPESPQYFVTDIEKFHLHADPKSIPEERRDEIAGMVNQILSITGEEATKVRKQLDRKSRDRKLKTWMDREERGAVLDWWRPYAKEHRIARNALFFTSDYQRSYPFGKLLGQVLHTVRLARDPITHQAIPTGGLELSFNQYLKGKMGKRRLMRSPRHALEMGEVIEPPEDGADIYLTINHYLQGIVEEELAKGVRQAGAKGGWAIMLNPFTGEVLALAQYPFFYPENYREYFNDKELLQHTRVRAVSDAFEPGSIMKAFTVTIALMANEELQARGEAPLFSPDEKIPTSNGRFPGRTRPISDIGSHNYLNMYMGLQKSSNIYMGRLIQRVINRLGKKWYRDKLTETFGFGKKTNLEVPGETRGVIPTPGKVHPNGKLEWSKPTPYSLAMGHNLQVNSVQIARAFSAIANGGYLIEPTLIKKVVQKGIGEGDEVVFENVSEDRLTHCPRVMSEKIRKEVIKGLKYVTKGYLSRGDIWGYTEVGKTGTARKIENGTYTRRKHTASFVGFAPVEKPAFVLMITLDEPEVKYTQGIGHNENASVCAAPIFRQMATRSLEYLGVAPDDPYGYPPKDPRYDPNQADWVTETRALKELYRQWNQ